MSTLTDEQRSRAIAAHAVELSKAGAVAVEALRQVAEVTGRIEDLAPDARRRAAAAAVRADVLSWVARLEKFAGRWS